MMNQDILDLYDEYAHAPLSRRVFLRRLAKLAGSTAAAAALMPLLENPAAAEIVARNDNRISTSYITYPGATGAIRAYMARPRGSGKLPSVVVIHENRGLNAHIEDVTRRLAVEGFLAIAPDALSPLGGTPPDRDKARNLIYKLDGANTLRNFLAAVSFLKGHSSSNGKVGCVGFCWGGSMANQLAVNAPDLTSAVVFYGRSPNSAEIPKIRASLLLNYAGLDRRIGAGVPAYEAALKAAGKDYTLYMYEGVNHAFHNDTSSARYDKRAAQLAWKRTIAFFSESLK